VSDDINLGAIKETRFIRLQPQDVLVLKMAESPTADELRRMRAQLSQALGFHALVMVLGRDDDVAVVRYENAVKEAQR
jgi:hypothetical protein